MLGLLYFWKVKDDFSKVVFCSDFCPRLICDNKRKSTTRQTNKAIDAQGCKTGEVFDADSNACIPNDTSGGEDSGNDGKEDGGNDGKEEVQCEDGQEIEAGKCVNTAAYCSSVGLSFDSESKVCVKEAKESASFSIGGEIKYYNGAEQDTFKLKVNGQHELDISAGAKDFLFEKILDMRDTYWQDED